MDINGNKGNMKDGYAVKVKAIQNVLYIYYWKRRGNRKLAKESNAENNKVEQRRLIVGFLTIIPFF